MLFITRERQSEGTLKHDDDLSNADPTTPVSEFARVAKAEHRIEECFHRSKSDAGLGDDQVRNGIGWHHHQTLSLIAAWFLNEETRRGKNPDTRDDRPSSPPTDRRSNRTPTPIAHAAATTQRWLQRNELACAARYEARNILPPLKNQLRT